MHHQRSRCIRACAKVHFRMTTEACRIVTTKRARAHRRGRRHRYRRSGGRPGESEGDHRRRACLWGAGMLPACCRSPRRASCFCGHCLTTCTASSHPLHRRIASAVHPGLQAQSERCPDTGAAGSRASQDALVLRAQAVDAVAGSMTGTVAASVREGGLVLVYGALVPALCLCTALCGRNTPLL
jgi:hypothetical protein